MVTMLAREEGIEAVHDGPCLFRPDHALLLLLLLFCHEEIVRFGSGCSWRERNSWAFDGPGYYFTQTSIALLLLLY